MYLGEVREAVETVGDGNDRGRRGRRRGRGGGGRGRHQIGLQIVITCYSISYNFHRNGALGNVKYFQEIHA